jgi:hypothetical protein
MPQCIHRRLTGVNGAGVGDGMEGVVGLQTMWGRDLPAPMTGTNLPTKTEGPLQL